MKNNRQLVRQWQLVYTLNAHRFGIGIDRLQRDLGVGRATVYRDLSVLQEAGVPIEKQTISGEVRYRLLRPSELPGIGLNALQISALHLARAELEALDGTGLVNELDTLLARCRPPDKQQTFRFAERPRKSGPSRSEIMKGIERALRARCRVRIEYRAASRGGSSSVLHVEPLLVNVADGDPYLRAYCVERAGERTYKLARITRLELTRDRATHVPADPPARSFEHSVKAWNGKPTLVKVRLDTAVAWLADEYPLIKGQTVEPAADGSVTVAANVSGIVEAMAERLPGVGLVDDLLGSRDDNADAAFRALVATHVREYAWPATRATGRTIDERVLDWLRSMASSWNTALPLEGDAVAAFITDIVPAVFGSNIREVA